MPPKQHNPAFARIFLDLPAWAMDVITREAKRYGIGREDLLSVWIVDHIDSMKMNKK